MLSDDLARPTYQPFAVDALYEWIECDIPRYAGFRIEARTNLRNRERKRLSELLEAQEEERRRIDANALREAERIDVDRAAAEARRVAAIEAGDADAVTAALRELSALADERVRLLEGIKAAFDASFAKVHEAIAPHIRDWTLAYHEDGILTAVPPPAQIGVEAFEDVDQTMLTWIVGALLSAYKGGKGLSGSPQTPAVSDEPAPVLSETTSSAGEPENQPEKSRPSRASSRSRSRSMSSTSDPGSTGTWTAPSST